MAKTSDQGHPKYVIDCEALAEVSATSNNAIRSVVVGLLDTVGMIVPTAVCDELATAFEDASDSLAPHLQIAKVRMKPKYRVAAGTLASKQNSGFRIEPYGESDLIAAAVAACEQCIVVTTEVKKSFYLQILPGKVMSIEDLVIIEG
jgi:hypothetical protein